MKILAVTVFVAGVLLVPTAAHATPSPCFDFSCSSSSCSFDPSCSTEQSSIWKYNWDFDDGSGQLGGGGTVNHNYDPICFPEVTLEIWTWDAQKISVSCFIDTDYPGCPGPPSAPTSGRCEP